MPEITCRTCAGIKKEVQYFVEIMSSDKGTGHYQFTAVVDAVYTNEIITIERQGSYRIKLNFCPECGASIKRRLRQWKQETEQDTLKQP